MRTRKRQWRSPRRFEALGYSIYATQGNCRCAEGGRCKGDLHQKDRAGVSEPSGPDPRTSRSTWSSIHRPQGADRSRDGFLIRRNAIETGVNVLTAMDTARALVTESGKYRYSQTDTGGYCKSRINVSEGNEKI